jgi:hypothetical protein
MATYRPDVGQVFESDVHRRVLAGLPAPEDTPADLTLVSLEVFVADDNLPFNDVDSESAVEILQVVEALVDAGFATYDEDTGQVQRTSTGTAELEAPVANEPPALEPDEVARIEEANAVKVKADEVRAAKDRIVSLQHTLEEVQAAIAEAEAVVAEGEVPAE